MENLITTVIVSVPNDKVDVFHSTVEPIIKKANCRLVKEEPLFTEVDFHYNATSMLMDLEQLSDLVSKETKVDNDISVEPNDFGQTEEVLSIQM